MNKIIFQAGGLVFLALAFFVTYLGALQPEKNTFFVLLYSHVLFTINIALFILAFMIAEIAENEDQ